jgi:sialate O-acetylesterase
MAGQWREHFGQDFYFIWGTLTRNTKASPPIEPQPAWFYRSATNGEIRKAIEHFGEDGRAALVELYDVGDHETHFLQKAEASRRFGLAALTLAYGQNHIYSGPLKADLTIEGGKAIVRFDRVGDGLIYKPSIDGISGVYVKGKDTAYRWAHVEVTGKDAIEVSHPDVPEITAVGYAVNDNPHETLFNSEGYPASPFKMNMERLPWSGHSGGTRLVALDGSSPSKPDISITHVRRGGYVFQLIGARGMPKDAQATVRAYIPKEWDAYVVESGQASIETGAKAKGDARFVTFTAPVDRTWIIVAEKDQVDDFRGINRF